MNQHLCDIENHVPLDHEIGYNVGQVIGADIFEEGEIVDVTGTSKGKGFQGVIKRYNQSRGPMGHGSQSFFFSGFLTAVLIVTKDFLAPGTLPLTKIQLFS